MRTHFLKGFFQALSLSSPLTTIHVREQVCFDLSLARGLDYYTGVIMEAVSMGMHVTKAKWRGS